jgi:hypothetical protein
MISGVQPKILLTHDEDGNLHINKNMDDLLNAEPNWKLVREHDGLTRQSKAIVWLEWNQDSTFKARHDEPAVGRSLLMSPFTMSFTWQTTVITELLEVNDKYIKFRTENSTYELFKL